MNIIKKFIFALLILHAYPGNAAKICYFSLNSSSEFQAIDKFTSKINQYAKEKIEIKEFLTPGEKAEEAFKKMVISGEQCDGLVISGHHTGSFAGKNSPTSLSIDFIEKLSCNPQYKDFFTNIKALWLQGCRTLGVGKIEAYEDPDFHTERVGEVVNEDNLPQNFAQLNMEFSATLDQDNPLSSRYLRVFPRATTFGWTKTAPGEKWGSENSIPFHIANIARRNDDRGRFFDNPISENISSESAIKYLNSLEELLEKKLVSPNNKCNRNEKKLVDAWIDHGNIKNSKYALNNPELNAYESLYQSNNEILIQAGELDCILKNANDSSIILALDTILKNEANIGYSYNSVYELLKRLKSEGKFELLKNVQEKLKSSELIQKFIMRKLASHELGILSKIDYYSFWKEMTNSTNMQIEKTISEAFVKMAIAPTDNNPNRIDYNTTLFQSMSKHNFISTNQLQMIINSPMTDIYSLRNIANSIGMSKTKLLDSDKMLQKLIDLQKKDGVLLGRVASAIGNSKNPITGSTNILQQIIDSPDSNAYSLKLVAYAIEYSKMPIDKAETMLQKLIDSPKSDTETLKSVTHTITNSTNQNIIKNRDQFIKQLAEKSNK